MTKKSIAVLKSGRPGLGGTPAWEQLAFTGGPPLPRYSPVGGYSSRTNRLVITQGLDLSTNTILDDTWALTNANGVETSQYTFLGFYAPVDNLPTVNKANAGQAIPIKWSLEDANGQFVSDLGAVKGYGFGSLASCDGTADAIEEYNREATTSLRYDFASNQFILNAKTEKGWAGSCKVFTVTLADGTQYQARFHFVK